MSIYYEIRVAGLLPPGVLLDFEELSASPQQAQTVLHGSLEDQKELRKLLDRLQIFGARLVEVRSARAGGPDGPPHCGAPPPASGRYSAGAS